VELKTDIAFATVGGVTLTLDAFVPEGDGPFPTCILVHGGGLPRSCYEGGTARCDYPCLS